MATPHQPDRPAPGDHTDSAPVLHEDAAVYDDEAPRVLRLRVAKWDVTCTVLLLILLAYLGLATTWPARLFGFLGDVCDGESCGPVPGGIDMYIRPIAWGGIGAAIAAAVLGPLVSLLKGWYMSFWPVLALTIVMVSSVAGSLLTTFSQRYWA